MRAINKYLSLVIFRCFSFLAIWVILIIPGQANGGSLKKIGSKLPGENHGLAMFDENGKTKCLFGDGEVLRKASINRDGIEIEKSWYLGEQISHIFSDNSKKNYFISTLGKGIYILDSSFSIASIPNTNEDSIVASFIINNTLHIIPKPDDNKEYQLINMATKAIKIFSDVRGDEYRFNKLRVVSDSVYFSFEKNGGGAIASYYKNADKINIKKIKSQAIRGFEILQNKMYVSSDNAVLLYNVEDLEYDTLFIFSSKQIVDITIKEDKDFYIVFYDSTESGNYQMGEVDLSAGGDATIEFISNFKQYGAHDRENNSPCLAFMDNVLVSSSPYGILHSVTFRDDSQDTASYNTHDTILSVKLDIGQDSSFLYSVDGFGGLNKYSIHDKSLRLSQSFINSKLITCCNEGK